MAGNRSIIRRYANNLMLLLLLLLQSMSNDHCTHTHTQTEKRMCTCALLMNLVPSPPTATTNYLNKLVDGKQIPGIVLLCTDGNQCTMCTRTPARTPFCSRFKLMTRPALLTLLLLLQTLEHLYCAYLESSFVFWIVQLTLCIFELERKKWLKTSFSVVQFTIHDLIAFSLQEKSKQQ